MRGLTPFLRVIAGSLLVIASGAGAATFLVSSVADEVDARPGDGACAAQSGHCTLRAAVMEANALREPDSVQLPAGVYVLSIPGEAGLQEDGSRTGSVDAADGDLDVLDDLEVVGLAEREMVVIEAIPSAPHKDRHFDVAGGASLTLRSLTLRNGSGDAYNEEEEGGSIRSGGELLLIRNVILRDNRADFFGGAIIAGNEVRIEKSLFERNRTLSSDNGGAIECGGGTLLVADSTFRSNLGDDGGAIYAGGCVLSVIRSQFLGNVAESGGAIAAYYAPGTIERSRFVGNGAYWGGAVICNDCDIADSEFIGNEGPVIIGAREVRSSTVMASNANDSVAGPILFADSVLNSTISGNVYDEHPVAVEAGRILFSTIVDNASTDRSGGAVGAPFVFGSIIARNTTEGASADCTPSLVSMGRNLLGSADGCTTAPTDLAGSALDPLDPKLELIALDEGPTPTHRLLRVSPAIDAIPVAECTYDADRDPLTPPVPLTRDQRGARRPMQVACDIGAYEAGPACADGIDNDRDGRIDYPSDKGCASTSDPSEKLSR